MFLFGRSQKSPAEIVNQLKGALLALEKGDKKGDKGPEETARWLQAYEGILFGHEGQEPNPANVSFSSSLTAPRHFLQNVCLFASRAGNFTDVSLRFRPSS